MAAPIDVAMPADITLDQGFSVRITCLSPVDGSLVAGAKVGTVVITADNLSGGALASGSFGPFMFVPGPGA
jgi:hypothetical protein